MKHFKGQAYHPGQRERGINDYEFIRDCRTGEPYVMLRGTFTKDELQMLLNAFGWGNNIERFEFPETVKKKDN